MTDEYEKPEDESRHAVKDPEEYAQQRIRKSLFDKKDDVQERRLSLSDPTLMVSRADKERALFEASKSYVMELESALEDEGMEQFGEFWNDKVLGEVRIEPPQEAVEAYRKTVAHAPPGATPPETFVEEVRGLDKFVELQPPYAKTWAVQSISGQTVDTETFTRTTEVPWSISEAAFRACNKFIASIGLNLEIEEEEQRWKI